jgi:L-iditol 2-dehydrogenase
VLVGLSSQDMTPIDTNEIVDKAISLSGVFRYANTWPLAIDLLAKSTIDLTPMISVHMDLDATDEALEFARTRKGSCIKVMVTP